MILAQESAANIGQQLFQAFLVVLGSLLAIVGGWLQAHVESRRARDAYWRDHLHAAYAEAFRFLRTVDRAHDAAEGIFTDPDDVRDQGAMAEIWLEEGIYETTQKVIADIELIVPQQIVNDLARLPRAARDEARELTDQLRRDMRQQLGVAEP